MQAIVKAGDEEESAAALNMLAEVAECPASLIGKSLPDIATWCFRVATARELPLAVRHAAMQVENPSYFCHCCLVVCQLQAN